MIFTLGVNAVMRGLMVAHTGGFAPQTAATDLMEWLATGKVLGISKLEQVRAGSLQVCCVLYAWESLKFCPPFSRRAMSLWNAKYA